VTSNERLRIAVFIDFDNIEIGVKNTLNAAFDAGLVLDALKERGEVVSKMAYSDWQRAGGYSRALSQYAIRMVQRNLTPGGDKNGADINLALDALEMAFTHPHINAFVIVGGDSDFISLLEKLKQYDKKVFVVGGKQFTSQIMQKNCHEFIAYENLVGRTGPRRQSGDREPRADRLPLALAVPLVTRALKVLSERDGAPPLGLLKTTLLQLDSTFDERSYGAGSFRDFAQKLEKLGLLKVQQGRGGWVVLASDAPHGEQPGGDAAADATTTATGTDGSSAPPQSPANSARADRGGRGDAGGRGEASRGDAPAVIGSNADGVKELIRVLRTANIRRWPLYLRNIKQAIRQVAPTFDERAYGFGQILDLVRAAQKDGLLRMERDRQGVVRVFQGNAFESGAVTGAAAGGEVNGNVIDRHMSGGPEKVDEIDEDEDNIGNRAEPGYRHPATVVAMAEKAARTEKADKAAKPESEALDTANVDDKADKADKADKSDKPDAAKKKRPSRGTGGRARKTTRKTK
jgi:uncharacterized LabA/DUF88 family protein